jgi:CRP-like cAMP-binding protein/phosphoribosyl 1,2-cyclic phosphodiesterase
MLVRFWGTRGSIPTPGRRTAFFGGNTSCVEIRATDGSVVLLDCGTGARPLGLDILSRGSTLPPMHILVTHTHWDHIQGFPFFLPAYVPGGRLTVYGARGLERTLEGSMSGQMQQTYFPVQLGELRADIDFVELSEEQFSLGAYRVTTQFLNHTAPTIGYRLEAGDLKIVYVTDHEPFWWTPGRTGAPPEFLHPGEERHIAFIAGADLLIHDAQYVDREYPSKRGWGHSTIEYVTDVAVRAGVKRLALFHHDPVHSDAWIRQQTERARRRAENQDATIQIFAAAEGLELALDEPFAGVPKNSWNGTGRSAFSTPTGRILLMGESQEYLKEVRDVIGSDGYEIVTHHGRDASVGEKVSPDLLILVGSQSEAALLEEAKSTRAEPWASTVPMLLLPGSEGPGPAGCLIDGITDVLSRPFNPAILRPRVRAWLSRTGNRVQARPATHRPRQVRPSTLPARGVLQGLPFAERAALLTGALRSRFRAGEVIFREGDPPGGVYFLRSGRVRISIQLPEGRERMLGIAKVGDTVGELAALDGGPRTATARAIEATTADYVPRETFEAGLAAAPGAAVHLLRVMARRLRRTDRYVGELMGGKPPAPRPAAKDLRRG